VSELQPLPGDPAAERWAELLSGWGVPQRILDQATESPWSHDPARFAVDHTLDRDGVSTRWAREVLPPLGGTVLDVGCGGGRSSMPLVPPANELIGVDANGAMLDDYVAAANRLGVARRTIHGVWPDVAPHAPVADVVVCHHVAFNVSEIVPFLWALTTHARLAVVLEVPTVHPMSAWTPAWRHFWGLERPDGPTSDDLLAVVREMGLDPEHTTGPRGRATGYESDPATLVSVARRRLCLPPERDPELAELLDRHPPAWADTMATFRWPGSAETQY
jgi:SAM-dependent methyltransferase